MGKIQETNLIFVAQRCLGQSSAVPNSAESMTSLNTVVCIFLISVGVFSQNCNMGQQKPTTSHGYTVERKTHCYFAQKSRHSTYVSKRQRNNCFFKIQFFCCEVFHTFNPLIQYYSGTKIGKCQIRHFTFNPRMRLYFISVSSTEQ